MLILYSKVITVICIVIKFTISKKAHNFDKLFQFIFYVTICTVKGKTGGGCIIFVA